MGVIKQHVCKAGFLDEMWNVLQLISGDPQLFSHKESCQNSSIGVMEGTFLHARPLFSRYGVLRKLKHIFPNTYQRIKSIHSPAKVGTGCYRFNYQPGS